MFTENAQVNDEAVNRLQYIELKKIYIGDRFRKDYGEMEDFVESIKEKGVLTPITVRPYEHPDYDYELMAGGRRVSGSQSAGLVLVPALIRDIGDDDLDLREVELFENIFRKEMEWHEKIALVGQVEKLWANKYKDTPWKWSQRKCAKLFGISHTHLNRQLDLARAVELIPQLKEAKDENEARKKLKQMQEKVTVKRAIEAQQVSIKAGGLPLVQLADANYNVGDALEGLEAWSILRTEGMGAGVRLIEVDPPYAIDLVNVKGRKDSDDPDLVEYNEVERKDYTTFLNRVAELCYACAEDDAWLIFWFGPSWFTDVKLALIRAGWNVDPIPCIWVKGNGQTNAPNYYLARCYEPFFVARKGGAVVRNKGRSNVFAYAPVSASAKYHPTQRPLALMEDILSTWGYPNSTVISPFLGSGTTIRAAYRQHMRCIGWDLSGEYKKSFLVAVEEDEKAGQEVVK